jgi:hypothetical protein
MTESLGRIITKYLTATILWTFLLSIVGSSQTAEPTPIPHGTIEYYQKQLVIQEKKDIESNEPRERHEQFDIVDLVNDEWHASVGMLSLDNKKNGNTIFTLQLGFLEGQRGGTLEGYKETIKYRPPFLPKITIDTSSNPIELPLIQSGFSGGFSAIDGVEQPPAFAYETMSEFVMTNEQVDELMRASLMNVTYGERQFSVSPDGLLRFKKFIERERRITKLSSEYAKSKKRKST